MLMNASKVSEPKLSDAQTKTTLRALTSIPLALILTALFLQSTEAFYNQQAPHNIVNIL
jgi:hypothetical protein